VFGTMIFAIMVTATSLLLIYQGRRRKEVV
jgi:hypothetical protein